MDFAGLGIGLGVSAAEAEAVADAISANADGSFSFDPASVTGTGIAGIPPAAAQAIAMTNQQQAGNGRGGYSMNDNVASYLNQQGLSGFINSVLGGTQGGSKAVFNDDGTITAVDSVGALQGLPGLIAGLFGKNPQIELPYDGIDNWSSQLDADISAASVTNDATLNELLGIKNPNKTPDSTPGGKVDGPAQFQVNKFFAPSGLDYYRYGFNPEALFYRPDNEMRLS